MHNPAVQPGYGNVKAAAAYAGVGERAFREWIKEGMPHYRVKGTRILIRFEDLDNWLVQWRTTSDQAGGIVDQLFQEVIGDA